MGDETVWGRVGKTKQQRLPGMANDRCGGIDRNRYPAWTESMRAALETRRETGGKWYRLIDRILGLVRYGERVPGLSSTTPCFFAL